MSKVLEHYSRLGVAHVLPYKLAGFQPNGPASFQHLYLDKRGGYRNKQQVLAHTDCLFRNMHRFKYLGNFDIDEVRGNKKKAFFLKYFLCSSSLFR